jgi:hypothetical protein
MRKSLRNLLDTLLIGSKISLWQLADMVMLLLNMIIGVSVGVIAWKILREK